MLSPSLSLCSVLKGSVVHQLLADKKLNAGFHRETVANIELEFETAEIQNRDFITASEAYPQSEHATDDAAVFLVGFHPPCCFRGHFPSQSHRAAKESCLLCQQNPEKQRSSRLNGKCFASGQVFLLLVAHEIACTEKKKRVGAWHWSLHRWHKPLHALLSSKRV